MARSLIALALCASLFPLVTGAAGTVSNDNHDQADRSTAKSVNPVVQWNRRATSDGSPNAQLRYHARGNL